MTFSLCEYISENYYKMENYIVEKNVPILPDQGKQHWSDLDLLAIGKKVLLINCKDFLPSSKDKEKIVLNLNTAETYIKGKYVFLKDTTFKKIYIYGGTDKSTLDFLGKKGIETIQLENIFCRYVKLIDDFLAELNKKKPSSTKKGMRYYRVGNLTGVDKFISYLLNNSLLNEDKVNNKLKEFKISELSRIKK